MIAKSSKIIGAALVVNMLMVLSLLVVGVYAVIFMMQQDSTYVFILGQLWGVLAWVVLLHCTLICGFLLYIEFLYTKNVEDQDEDEHQENPVG